MCIRILKRKHENEQIGDELPPLPTGLAVRARFDAEMVNEAIALVQKYSTIGYHNGTKRIPAQGALPTLQKANAGDPDKHSIESVIHEIRQNRARRENKSIDNIAPYGESFVYKIANLVTPEKCAVPTKRNQMRVEALSDMYAAISMATILGAVHAPFGLTSRVSRFLSR